MYKWKEAEVSAFNSLSRDHRTGGVACLQAGLGGLSTPSLGITSREPRNGARVCRQEICTNFQLPLSGSRDHLGVAQIVIGLLLALFQLPLSGSLARVPLIRTASVALSTPSLGITRQGGGGAPALPDLPAFNSLSRDHRARFRDFSALRGFLPRHPFAQVIPKATIWIYRFAPL